MGVASGREIAISLPVPEFYQINNTLEGMEVWPEEHAVWRYSKENHERIEKEGRLYWGPKESYKKPRLKRFLSEIQAGVVPSTWWDFKEVGHNDEGQKETGELLGRKIFSTPKPVRLLNRILRLATETIASDLIVDFFAGSCSTSQAVLEMNRADGGNRRFIMVQLPEPTENKEYPTIAEIGKERIRRVIAKLTTNAKDTLAFADGTAPEDLGFKVFKLAAPNIHPWNADSDRDPDAYARKLTLFDDPLADGWTPTNVLWEVALREGFGLRTRFTPRTLANGNTVHEARDPESGQHFFACLDDRIGPEFICEICEICGSDGLLVCRDVALDDSTAANLALQCRLKTI